MIRVHFDKNPDLFHCYSFLNANIHFVVYSIEYIHGSKITIDFLKLSYKILFPIQNINYIVR